MQGRDIFHDVFGDNIALFMEECAIMEEEQKNQRVQTIKQVIADQYKKRERFGYDTLQGQRKHSSVGGVL